MSNPPPSFSFCVGPSQAGVRLDTLVAAEIDHCSRSFAATLVRQGCITVDGSSKKPGYLLKAGECISGVISAPETLDFQPEAIPLQILFEDTDLLVVNKAPNMVVHPAPGHPSGTLVNALLHHCPDLAGICGSLRPGIVHRLDKDTSGALIVAKNTLAMHSLADQFKSRKIRKHYFALVYGIPVNDSGTIDLPIGRHPTDRKKMSVHTRTPRTALTHWQVRERFTGTALLELDIRTGRTHQIRVHCLALGHPVIGDQTYGNRGVRKRLNEISAIADSVADSAGRQMLHARRLCFNHPVSGQSIKVNAPMPEDMTRLIDHLREI